jgi:hypothetical protein
LGPTSVTYNISKLSRVKKEKEVVRTNPDIFTVSEKL